MNCVECKTTNPDGNLFCGQCGAELGRSSEETVRKRGFRDRQATEFEITHSVVERLMTWARWLGTIVAVIVALFVLLIGKSYMDVRTTVQEGKTEIATAVLEGKRNIEPVVTSALREVSEFQQRAASINEEYRQLQSDIGRYKEVNKHIEGLQKEITAVKGQIIDLGSNSTLRVGALETTSTGEGGSSLSFARLGCQPSVLSKGQQVAYCAQGSPLVLFQRTLTGDLRPVASLSPVGFQDASSDPKPTCTAANRGTFYVEKGTGKVADKPFLCARRSDNTYAWVQLGIAPN